MEEELGVYPPKTDSQNLALRHPKTERQSPICLNNGRTRNCDTLEVRVIVIGCNSPPPLPRSAIFSSFFYGAWQNFPWADKERPGRVWGNQARSSWLWWW